MGTDADVLVIGGGPGGSTAAALLAREGRRVTLVDRAVFPRYHIGESLLPAVLLFLEELGIREEVEQAGFHRKIGQTFIWGRDPEPWELDFRTLDAFPYSFFVERARFDDILLRNAARLGANVVQGAAVTDLIQEDGRIVGAEVEGHGVIRARHVIDASGQAALIATRQRLRRFVKGLKSLAIWAYFEDVGIPAPPQDEHIYSIATDDGWVWWIPMRKGVASVGIVTSDVRGLNREKGSKAKLQDWYLETVHSTQIVGDLLKGARQIDGPHVARDWSYRAERFFGPGWMLVGDAACFIDPILSTGVNLAMSGGYLAALALHSTLHDPAREETFLRYFQRAYRAIYDEQLASIRHFYAVGAHRESVYWKAKRLLRVDPELERDLAFVFINSGLARHVTAMAPHDVAGQARTLFGSRLTDHAAPAVAYAPGTQAERQLVPAGDVLVIEGDDRRLYGLVQRGLRLELEPYTGDLRPEGSVVALELESRPERDPVGVARIEPVRPGTPERWRQARGFTVTTRAYTRDAHSEQILGDAGTELLAIIEASSETTLAGLERAIRRALRVKTERSWALAPVPKTDQRDLTEQPVSAEYAREDGNQLWIIARPRRRVDVLETPFCRTRFIDLEYRASGPTKDDSAQQLLHKAVSVVRAAVARRDRLSGALTACEHAFGREIPGPGATDWRLVAVRRVQT